MLFPDALKIEFRINPNGSLDFTLGPVKVEGISFQFLKIYHKDKGFIEEVLTKMAGREVMFAPAHKEHPPYVIESLQSLETDLRKYHATLSKRLVSDQDRLLGSILLLTADDVHRCWSKIKYYYDADKGVDRSEHVLDWRLMAELLGPMRVTSYHTMAFLLNLLPPDNPYRVKSQKRLSEGFRTLKEFSDLYKVKDEDFERSGWHPSSRAEKDDAYSMIFAGHDDTTHKKPKTKNAAGESGKRAKGTRKTSR